MAVSALTEQVVLYSITADRFASAVGSLDEMIAAVEAQVRQREALAGQSRIELSQLEMMRTLGVGTFGRVRLVRDRKSGRPYALKLLDKRQVVHHRQEAHLLQEKQLLLLCHHPFIIELACTFQTETHLYMLMEVCLGGELFSRLKKMGSLPDADAKFYVACIVSAFSYMHQRRIAYRDLKPENILLDAQGYCKIVDFGFAKQARGAWPPPCHYALRHANSYATCCSTRAPRHAGHSLHTLVVLHIHCDPRFASFTSPVLLLCPSPARSWIAP